MSVKSLFAIIELYHHKQTIYLIIIRLAFHNNLLQLILRTF